MIKPANNNPFKSFDIGVIAMSTALVRAQRH